MTSTVSIRVNKHFKWLVYYSILRHILQVFEVKTNLNSSEDSLFFLGSKSITKLKKIFFDLSIFGSIIDEIALNPLECQMLGTPLQNKTDYESW